MKRFRFTPYCGCGCSGNEEDICTPCSELLSSGYEIPVVRLDSLDSVVEQVESIEGCNNGNVFGYIAVFQDYNGGIHTQFRKTLFAYRAGTVTGTTDTFIYSPQSVQGNAYLDFTAENLIDNCSISGSSDNLYFACWRKCEQPENGRDYQITTDYETTHGTFIYLIENPTVTYQISSVLRFYSAISSLNSSLRRQTEETDEDYVHRIYNTYSEHYNSNQIYSSISFSCSITGTAGGTFSSNHITRTSPQEGMTLKTQYSVYPVSFYYQRHNDFPSYASILAPSVPAFSTRRRRGTSLEITENISFSFSITLTRNIRDYTEQDILSTDISEILEKIDLGIISGRIDRVSLYG